MTLPKTGNTIVRAAEWTPAGRPGEFLCAMVDDPAGYRTMLSKVPPGPLGDMHAHDTIEQIYVIDGDFYDDDASYGPGDFVLRMPGTPHRAGSRNGCTMLLVYAPLVTQ
jgi:anti-sigma factor ChrR (cupin superfamily)